MILALIAALLLGVLSGTITGLAPGIHINLISAILLGSLTSIPFLDTLPKISLAVFIVSMAVTHSFLDFIPSIFLGAPDEDSFLSILPGHQLLKQGKGYEAVVLTLYGSLLSIPIILIFIPIFIFILPVVYRAIYSLIPFILIFASLYLVFREKEFLIPLSVFFLAGFLGLLTFNLPVKEPLLPLLTGLFGSSALIVSLKDPANKLQKQLTPPLKQITLPKKQILKSSLAASLSAPLCSFLPGIGSGHAAVIGSEIFEHDSRSFLFLVGAINLIVTSLNFVALYAINKTRSGAAVAVKSLLNTVTAQNLAVIITAIIFSALISFFLGIKIAKLSSRYIYKINYKLLSIITLIILLLVNIAFSNLLGILVLFSATSLGIFTILSNSRRINLMGALLIPTIIFYLAL